ncbi:MASE4 domain-containing protein [Sphingomonas quercus]|uniref:histidine kinase n=1 Tax=Sphingomonas quercus TaxID=2842451 RepID=A0ABS6BKK5_9SPHN|nr:MASE4 domain-containing protein [Sphingomonas quercus]MBU3078833.1 MASE4 domain-containing protein [Sphingomonas quercus]
MILLVIFVCAKPLSGLQLYPLQPFIPFYVTAIFLNDLITACLLFAQFSILRTRAMLIVANGYLFAALMLIPYTLSFPDVFSSGSLAGNLQSTPWLYIVRHCGLALFLSAFALADRSEQPPFAQRMARTVMPVSMLVTTGLVLLAAFVCIHHRGALPIVIDDTRRFSMTWPLYAGIPIACSYAVALALLWFRRNTILGLWLMVVALVHLTGVPLGFHPAPARFSVGWYTVILMNLAANTLVLVVLLFEFSKLYARVMQAVRAQYLEREARLVTGDAVAAMISHDVKQPLSAMITRAEAGLRRLERDTPDLEKAKADIKQVAADGHRAAEVIDSIRANFKKGARIRTLLDLNALVRETVALLRDDLQRHGVIVEDEMRARAATVYGDRTQLQQVVLNLCTNAIDAMLDEPPPRKLTIGSATRDTGELVVTVSDTGKGVAPQDIEHIFNPLFSTKADGMGMGLSICRSIIEAHDGRISVLRNQSKGAVLEFALPLA